MQNIMQNTLYKSRHSKMIRLGLSLAPVFLWAASAQAAPRTVYFWNSAAGVENSRANLDKARTGVWGNGAVSESRDVRYEGANTLKITSRNFREGVRFDLKEPLDIAPYRDAGYLRFRLRFRESGAMMMGNPNPGNFIPGNIIPPERPRAVNPPADGFGKGGGFDDPEIFGDMQMRGNAQAGPLPPLGGMPILDRPGAMMPTGPAPQETPVTQILCTLILDNGVMEGTIDIPKLWENPRQVDFDKARPDSKGWLLLSLSMKEMRATPGASGLVRRMILSSDKQDSFYLTQSALVIETGEMTVSVRKISDVPGTQLAEFTTRPGAITFVADVEAGAADASIEWNFDADDVGNLPDPNPDGLAFPPRPPNGRVPGEMVLEEDENGAGVVRDVPFGPRIDARGLIARVDYPDEEQNYRIEVTVRDRAGKKKPVVTSILVHVRG